MPKRAARRQAPVAAKSAASPARSTSPRQECGESPGPPPLPTSASPAACCGPASSLRASPAVSATMAHTALPARLARALLPASSSETFCASSCSSDAVMATAREESSSAAAFSRLPSRNNSCTACSASAHFPGALTPRRGQCPPAADLAKALPQQHLPAASSA